MLEINIETGHIYRYKQSNYAFNLIWIKLTLFLTKTPEPIKYVGCSMLMVMNVGIKHAFKPLSGDIILNWIAI